MRVELAPDVIEVGLTVAVVPVGIPLTARFTVWAEPLMIVVLMVDVPEPPCTMDTEDGLALMEKSLVTGAVTVSDTVVVCVALVPVPVTVSV